MKVLTLCGSLRARSSNRAALRAYERLAPPVLTFEHFEKIGALPHFNPDLDGDQVPDEVARFRNRVNEADVLVVSTPEYVHALPGAFKNALDWLVSDPAFGGKRVVILQVARGSTWALESLREVLRTMSADILEAASVSLPLGSNQLDEDAILARDDLRGLLHRSIETLLGPATEPKQPEPLLSTYPPFLYKEDRELPLDQLLALYRANEWSSAEKGELLRSALRASHSLITAWDGPRLIGLGNAISDGFLVVYYPHLLVLPEFQGKGVGGEIVRRLKEKYAAFHMHMLVADGKAIDFYRKCGFERAGRTEPMWIYAGHDH